ncbi:MAG: class I SAM-dependent methyltransferase [Parcubacteria group bacterium]|nr:class I SAM-dependent methyltransferase [Parcubacteria group bacterium]
MFRINSKLTRESLKKFLEKNKSDDFTLDLGCKNSPYKNLFPNRVGLDVESGEGVDVVGDAHQLPFEDSKFEQILCTEVLEHLHTPILAIREMERVLKPGGKLILTTRFVFPIHDAPHDYYRYTKYGLRHLFRKWEILELAEETDTTTNLAVLFERLILQTESKYKFFKLIWLFFRFFLPKLKFLIKKEYGDINHTKEENNIMTSGYYLICRKK